MGRVKQLIQIINACEKKEFDAIVKSFLKNIYGYERIVVTDGKDDTGIDIKVFDIGGENNQYQMTVQKSENTQQKSQLKAKIFEDVAKAKINAEEYGYSNRLYFFYSYEMTNKIQREYKREALTQYKIDLEIIDAKQIAEESEEYLALQQTIYKISGFEEKHKSALLAVGAYVIANDKESTDAPAEYSYIQASAPNSGEKYAFISYNDIVGKPATDKAE